MKTSAACPNVLPEQRAHLAGVLEQFAAGQRSLRSVHSAVGPLLASADPGVAAIAELLDGLGSHGLGLWQRGWQQLTDQDRDRLHRCHRFLASTLPYEWPDPPPTLLPELAGVGLALLWVGGVGHLFVAIVLGLIGAYQPAPLLLVNAAALVIACGTAIVGAAFARRALQQWTQDTHRSYASAGDGAAWPFLRRTDDERARPKLT